MIRMDMKSKKKALKKATSPGSSKVLIRVLEKVMTDKHLKKNLISTIKSLDGKKIKNTSGT